MNLNEALELFAKEGVSGIMKLTEEELNQIQDEANIAYSESVEKFPEVVNKACDAIRSILNKPIK